MKALLVQSLTGGRTGGIVERRSSGFAEGGGEGEERPCLDLPLAAPACRKYRFSFSCSFIFVYFCLFSFIRVLAFGVWLLAFVWLWVWLEFGA